MASEYGATRLFDTERLRSVLDTLVHRLADRGVEGRIYLVGGAAMALAYYDEGERRMTADVDAWFTPVDAVDEEATAMAVELGLAGDWLNEGAVQFVPAHGLPDRIALFKHGEFAVEVGPPRLLLAVKLRAARLGSSLTTTTSPCYSVVVASARSRKPERSSTTATTARTGSPRSHGRASRPHWASTSCCRPSRRSPCRPSTRETLAHEFRCG